MPLFFVELSFFIIKLILTIKFTQVKLIINTT